MSGHLLSVMPFPLPDRSNPFVQPCCLSTSSSLHAQNEKSKFLVYAFRRSITDLNVPLGQALLPNQLQIIVGEQVRQFRGGFQRLGWPSAEPIKCMRKDGINIGSGKP